MSTVCKTKRLACGLAGVLLAAAAGAQEPAAARLMTLDPGHFHAALFQKEMWSGVAPQVDVYAPLGPDLLAHLQRVMQFNTRLEQPARWQLEVHAGSNSLERLLAERPGNVVVLSGNNRGKIDRLAAVVARGLHVLADKPWIIEPDELPRLEAALKAAEENGVAAYDAMTQRYEVSCVLARELARDPEIFGVCLPGSPEEPAVRMESVHYFLKEVAGAPVLRPAWFFDARQQGEALADVGVHLVDLVQWTLFPDQALDYRRDVAVIQGSHWPTLLSLPQFQRVTGEEAFPASARGSVREGSLECCANNRVVYSLRNVVVRLDVRWEFEPPPGGKDTEFAEFRGARSRIEVRQGREEQFVPEVFVVPGDPKSKARVQAALDRRVRLLQPVIPGLSAQDQGGRFRMVIPGGQRSGHEAHFAMLTRQFLEYVRNPKAAPAWERPNMAAKYYVTTQGVKLARENARKERP